MTVEQGKVVVAMPNGNALAIIGAVRDGLRKTHSREELYKIQKEMMSGDYDHLLQTAMEYVEFS